MLGVFSEEYKNFIQKLFRGEFDSMTCGELAKQYPQFTEITSPPDDEPNYVDALLSQIENLKCCGNCKKYIQNEGGCMGVWREKDLPVVTGWNVQSWWVCDVCSDWEYDGLEAKDRRAE